jgi:hypothetical protein
MQGTRWLAYTGVGEGWPFLDGDEKMACRHNTAAIRTEFSPDGKGAFSHEKKGKTNINEPLI